MLFVCKAITYLADKYRMDDDKIKYIWWHILHFCTRLFRNHFTESQRHPSLPRDDYRAPCSLINNLIFLSSRNAMTPFPSCVPAEHKKRSAMQHERLCGEWSIKQEPIHFNYLFPSEYIFVEAKPATKATDNYNERFYSKRAEQPSTYNKLTERRAPWHNQNPRRQI